MKTQPSIESSRRLYAFLLGFYPKAFRTDYGPSMLQIFTDQCRAAAAGRGATGLVTLWLRTFADLAVSLFREYLTATRESWGLLEAAPGKPLPWTGVILVLLPCLIFFAGQIGQIAGQDLFFVLSRRAGYFLIVPVLLVWVLTRKFPVWGLVPLGIFYYTIRNVVDNFEGYLAKYGGMIHYPLAVFEKAYDLEVRVAIILILAASCVVLAIAVLRRQRVSRTAWLWAGIFGLLLIPSIIEGAFVWWRIQNLTAMKAGLPGFVENFYSFRDYFDISYSAVVYSIEFLLLILAGAFLARRHGRLALLLPLGFIIPFVLVGRYDNTMATTGFLVWTSIAVFAYRILVTVVAPIWIVRSATDEGQGRAGIVGFAVAIGIVFLAHLGLWVNYIIVNGSMNGIDLPSFYYDQSPAIIVFVGAALAISLYRRKPAEATGTQASLPATA